MSLMALPHPIPEHLVELIARRFRLLSEPMRIRILDRLRDGEESVQELAEGLESTQQNVSRHLALMAEAGLLARRKERTHVYYRIADEGVLALCEQVCGSLEDQLRGLAALVDGLSPTPLTTRAKERAA
jgi:DNA-binding transcriptional ArsR family regulator